MSDNAKVQVYVPLEFILKAVEQYTGDTSSVPFWWINVLREAIEQKRPIKMIRGVIEIDMKGKQS